MLGQGERDGMLYRKFAFSPNVSLYVPEISIGSETPNPNSFHSVPNRQIELDMVSVRCNTYTSKVHTPRPLQDDVQGLWCRGSGGG